MIDLKSIPKSSGVYRLMRGEECIYVGSSRSLRPRIQRHAYLKLADRVEWEIFPVVRLQEEEHRHVQQYKPKLNRMKVARPKSDNRFPPEDTEVTIKSISFAEDDTILLKKAQTLAARQYLPGITATATIRIALTRMVQQLEVME